MNFETNVLSVLLYHSDKDGQGLPKAISQLEHMRRTHPPNALVEYTLGRANAEVPGSHPVLITLANLNHQANRMERVRKC